MTPKDVPTPLEVRYHGEKLHHVITVNVINIAKHIEATKITSRYAGDSAILEGEGERLTAVR